MNRVLSLALLIGGIVLLVIGFQAGDSFSSNLSEAVQGTPSDRSLILIGLGIVGTLVGGFGLLRRAR